MFYIGPSILSILYCTRIDSFEYSKQDPSHNKEYLITKKTLRKIMTIFFNLLFFLLIIYDRKIDFILMTLLTQNIKHAGRREEQKL